jgi:hypothetical protein
MYNFLAGVWAVKVNPNNMETLKKEEEQNTEKKTKE